MLQKPQIRLLVLIASVLLLVLISSAGFMTVHRNAEDVVEVPTQAQLPTLTRETVLATGTPLNPEPQIVAVVTTLPASATDVPVEVASAVPPVTQTATAAATDTSTPTTVPPTSQPVQIQVPDEPVPDQIIINFASDASDEERAAYIEQIGGTVVDEIDALDTVVVEVPEQIDRAALPESEIVEESEPDYFVSAQIDLLVNDPLFDDQWALPVIGAPEAWAKLPDDAPQVIVAVIDSGVCADHPDLEGRVLDTGYDFVNDDDDPEDDFGHGCGVAGIIAANVDNNIGIAGVAPNAQILPLKVLDQNGLGRYSHVAEAIVYAVDNGAEIINLSLGGAFESSVLQSAIDYALAQDVIVIAAAGNTGGDVLYPARYEPVIAVGSVDLDLQRSSFSSYGPEIDLLAPGRDILTTRHDGTHRTMSGTSFAAPNVAGVTALERAYGRELALGGGIVAVGKSDIAPTQTHTVTPTLENLTDFENELDEIIQQSIANYNDTHAYLPFYYIEIGRTVDVSTGGVIYLQLRQRENHEIIQGIVDLMIAVRQDNIWIIKFPGDEGYADASEKLPPEIIARIDKSPYEPPASLEILDSLSLDDYELPWENEKWATVVRSYNVHGTGRIDFDLDSGNQVVAAKSGTIIYVNDTHYKNGYDQGAWWYWNIVVIRHDTHEYSLYGHLAQNTIPQWIKNDCTSNYNQWNCSVSVQAGQVIGLEGNTGQSTNPHLHLETGQNFSINGYQDSLDEDNDGNTTELVYAGFVYSQHNITFSGYTSSDVATWSYGRRLQANHSTCPQSSGVILYWNANKNCNNTDGDAGYRQFSNTGVYNNFGGFNDKASSVVIPSGWSVLLSSNADGTGGSICINSYVADFGTVNYPGTFTTINDSVSRAVVFNNNNCSGGGDPGGGNCTPNDNQAALFAEPNYGDPCTTLNIGDYPNAGTMGIANDSVSSVRVGANVELELCLHDNFGNCSIFTNDDDNLANDSIDEAASSARVKARGGGDPNNVAVCRGIDGTDCQNFPTGIYDLGHYGLNDQVQSVRVPSGMSLFVFNDDGLRNTADCYTTDRIPLPIDPPWSLRGEVTSIVILGQGGCPWSQINSVVLFEDTNYGGPRIGLGNEAAFWNIPSMYDYFNDKVDSVHVPAGMSVILYEHNDRGGQNSGCLTGDVSSLGGLNNKPSSIDIFTNTNCSPPIPTAPSNLTFTDATQNSATISWQDTSNNETGFKIYRWDWISSFVYFDSVGANVTSYTDTTLSCGSDQYYEVSAYNSSGESPHAGWIKVTTSSCPVAPLPPTGVTAQDNSIGENYGIYLSWTVSPSGQQNIDGYKVYRTNPSAVFLVSKTSVGFIDSGLSCSTTYEYYVTAYKGSLESAPSNYATVTTVVCPVDNNAIIDGSVTFIGRGTPPDDRWRDSLTVQVIPDGTSTPILDQIVTTDEYGHFTVEVPPGTYRIKVKNSQSLINARTVTLTAGQNIVDMGQLRVGDVNADNIVDITDYSLLVGSFLAQPGDAGYNPNTDFNVDGITDISDYSILVSNFLEVSEQSAQGVSTNVVDPVMLSITPSVITATSGEEFDVSMEVNSGSETIIGAQVFVDFDPTLLEVVSVTPDDTLPDNLLNRWDNATGEIDLARVKLGSPYPSGTIPLATVRFRVRNTRSNTPSSTLSTFNMLRPRETKVVSLDGNVLSNTEDGLIVISGSSSSNAPVLNYYNISTPTLLWSSISWATGYNLEVSIDSEFTNIIYIYEGPELQTMVTPALLDGVYFWRARARRPDGTWGNWSEPDSFVINAP